MILGDEEIKKVKIIYSVVMQRSGQLWEEQLREKFNSQIGLTFWTENLRTYQSQHRSDSEIRTLSQGKSFLKKKEDY